MNRTKQQGSITVEAIVMLGLIAALTPILYKHVAERREDIDNINEANTMLLLKNTTTEYIEANKDTLAVGTRLIDPTDIGIDISGYKIGIRKDSSGKVSAMIAATEGRNDIKAAKVASLLGVSAGIYSAQDSSKAWGINGIWAENISSYGFTSMPTGIPVVTTTYDKEAEAGLNEDQLKDFIENNTFAKFSVAELYSDKICLQGECIVKWEDAVYDPIQSIILCNGGDNKHCKKAFENNLNTSCAAIAQTYKENEGKAPTGFYTLTTSATEMLYEQPCVFTNGNIATEKEVIDQCNASNNAQSAACRFGWLNDINRNCNSIIDIDSSRQETLNFITTETSGDVKFCVICSNPAGGICAIVNDTRWVRSTGAHTYWSAQTFCSNLGMELKSREYIQEAGLWNPGGSNPFGAYWIWSADLESGNGWVVKLGNNGSGIGDLNANVNGVNHEYATRYALCGPNPCATYNSISGTECRSVNGQPWVRSTGAKSYWDSQTFCSNLGMELKSRAQIQSAGLWNTGTNPFSVNYWYWSTDNYNNGYSAPNDGGWQVWLGTGNTHWVSRDNNWNTVDYYYALCGK